MPECFLVYVSQASPRGSPFDTGYSPRGSYLGARLAPRWRNLAEGSLFRLNYDSIPGRIVNFMMYSMFSGVSDILVCSVIFRCARIFPGVCIADLG